MPREEVCCDLMQCYKHRLEQAGIESLGSDGGILVGLD